MHCDAVVFCFSKSFICFKTTNMKKAVRHYAERLGYFLVLALFQVHFQAYAEAVGLGFLGNVDQIAEAESAPVEIERCHQLPRHYEFWNDRWIADTKKSGG